jgi:hypothetical protein
MQLFWCSLYFVYLFFAKFGLTYIWTVSITASHRSPPWTED